MLTSIVTAYIGGGGGGLTKVDIGFTVVRDIQKVAAVEQWMLFLFSIILSGQCLLGGPQSNNVRKSFDQVGVS